MSETHWKKFFNPNYMGDYSFEPGKDRVLTIRKVTDETVTGEGGKKDDCMVIYWEEDEKPMIMNKTNCKMVSKVVGSPITERWIGHRIQLWYDPSVKFGSNTVGGIRIRSKAPEDVQIACEECGQFIAPAFNMTASQLAAYTAKKFGKKLCAECAQEKKANSEKEAKGNDPEQQ